MRFYIHISQINKDSQHIIKMLADLTRELHSHDCTLKMLQLQLNEVKCQSSDNKYNSTDMSRFQRSQNNYFRPERTMIRIKNI